MPPRKEHGPSRKKSKKQQANDEETEEKVKKPLSADADMKYEPTEGRQEKEDKDETEVPYCSICNIEEPSAFPEAALVSCGEQGCAVAFHRWCIDAIPESLVARSRAASVRSGLSPVEFEAAWALSTQSASASASASAVVSKQGKKGVKRRQSDDKETVSGTSDASSASASASASAVAKPETKVAAATSDQFQPRRSSRSSSSGTAGVSVDSSFAAASGQTKKHVGKVRADTDRPTNGYVNAFTMTRNLSIPGGAATFAVPAQMDVMDEVVLPVINDWKSSSAASTGATVIRDNRWRCQAHRRCTACALPASTASPVVVSCDGCQRSWHTMQNCIPPGVTASVRQDFALGRVAVDCWTWTPVKGETALPRDAMRAPWFCAECLPLSVHSGLLSADVRSALYAKTQTEPMTKEQASLLSAELPWECKGRSYIGRDRVFRIDPTQLALFFQYWIERNSLHNVRYWRLHEPLREHGLAVPFSPFRTKECSSLETVAASTARGFGNFIRNYDAGGRFFMDHFKPEPLKTDKKTGLPVLSQAGAGRRRLRDENECRRALYQSIIYRVVNNAKAFEQWVTQTGKDGGAEVWARETKGKDVKPTIPFNKATVKSWLAFVRRKQATGGKERLFNSNHQNCGYERYIETVEWVANDTPKNGYTFTKVFEELLGATSREQAWNAVFKVPQVSSFFGAMILDDMENCGVAKYDVCDQRFSPMGPGARQGLAMIFPGIAEGEHSKDWRPFLEFLVIHSRTLLARLAPTPQEGLAAVNPLRLTVDAIDIENALCGYMRVAQLLHTKHHRGFDGLLSVSDSLSDAVTPAGDGKKARKELRSIREGTRICYHGCPGVVAVVFRNEWDSNRGFRIGISLDAPVPGGHNGASCAYRKGQAQLMREQQTELPRQIKEMEQKLNSIDQKLRRGKPAEEDIQEAEVLRYDLDQMQARLKAYDNSDPSIATPHLFFLTRPGCGLFVWSRNVKSLENGDRDFLAESVVPLQEQQQPQTLSSAPSVLPSRFMVRWQGFGPEDDTAEPRAGIEHTVAYGRWLLLESNLIAEAEAWRRAYPNLVPAIENEEFEPELRTVANTSTDSEFSTDNAAAMPSLETLGHAQQQQSSNTSTKQLRESGRISDSKAAAASGAKELDPLISRRVSVFWEEEGRAFKGTVVKAAKHGRYYVQYDDGDYQAEEHDVRSFCESTDCRFPAVRWRREELRLCIDRHLRPLQIKPFCGKYALSRNR